LVYIGGSRIGESKRGIPVKMIAVTLSAGVMILLIHTVALAQRFDIWSYITSSYHSNFSDLTTNYSTTIIDQRHADNECCWNGQICISKRPCPASDQDWVRSQFTLGAKNSNYDTFYRDSGSPPMIHYTGSYNSCNSSGNNCATSVVFGSGGVVFSQQIVDPGCGPAPFGDGTSCPSGSGRVSATVYSGSTVSCTGTNNYTWYVVPSGKALTGFAAGVDDLYALPLMPPGNTPRFDNSQPAVHIHWIQASTISSGRSCSNGTNTEEAWFGSTTYPGDKKAVLATFGGYGVYVNPYRGGFHYAVVP